MPGSSLTDLLIEYYRRLDAGERPRLEEFRARAGAQWGELVDLVRVEDAFKAAIREDPSLADYTIVDVVGEGAHGTVYEAIQQPLGRRVAVKVMRLGWTGKDDFRERFERAARAAAAVEHPHAVRIYDGGVDRDRAFLAMSLVRGPSLRELLERLRAVEDAPFGTGHHHVLDAARVPSGRAGVRGYVQRIAALLAGPADALAAYHGCSIVHRDVKPSNLLLGGDGRLRIADFDLMKDLSSSFQTQPWTPMGTPHYMAPEQWSGDSVGKAADVYGLGAVFWECLTLRAPFADAERDMLKDMALHTRPQDPASVVAGVPRDAAGVALKALEKQPRDRYADAHALADDLRRLAADEPVSARSATAVERGWRLLRRHRMVQAGLVGLVAFLVWWTAFRRGELHLFPWPGGTVFVDGEPAGAAPIPAWTVRRGEVRVVVRHPGFVDYETIVSVEPGAVAVIDPVLVPVDPLDPRVLAAWRKRGLHLQREPPTGSRTAADPPTGVVALLPRGAVRREDVARFAVETHGPRAGTLVLYDGEIAIERIPLALDQTLTRVPAPSTLAARLRTGRRYRWVVAADDGSQSVAEFVVVEPPASEVARRLQAASLAPQARSVMAVAALQANSLHAAAIRAAVTAHDRWARSEFLEAAWYSLTALELADSELGAAVRDAYLDALRKK